MFIGETIKKNFREAEFCCSAVRRKEISKNMQTANNCNTMYVCMFRRINR